MSARRRAAVLASTCAAMRPPAKRFCERLSPRFQVFLLPKGRLPSDANGLLLAAQSTACSSESSRWSTGSAGLGVKRPQLVGAVVVVVSAVPLPLDENCDASARLYDAVTPICG